MARQHYFYNVMRKTIIQFLDLFNDIVIARYNPDTGAIIKYVKVPLKFAPKTKQWYWSELKENQDRRDIVLPMMAVNLESVDFSADRQVNRNHRVSFSDTTESNGTERSGIIKQVYNAVPYDYVFSVQIAAEYMVDITQIVEQIFPFFTPEAYIRITIPDIRMDGISENGIDKLDLRVIYDSSDKQAPVELDEANFRVLVWTLKFKVQGYLFSPIYDTKSVHHISLNYYTSQESWNNEGAGDTNNVLGEMGSQNVMGVISAEYIPPDGEEIDEDVKNMYKYERYGQ